MKSNGLKNRVGEKHNTNEGYEVEIIEYINKRNVSVRFTNGTIIKNRIYWDIKNGAIKNPYHKSVYGVGYKGEGFYNSFHDSYEIWVGMIKRCYSKERHKIQPTYKNCFVDERWHNFQIFAKWYEDNRKEYVKGFHLDKDILVKGNKIYSPETCCFVPKEINNLFIKSNIKRGDLPIGVSKEGKKFKVQLSKRKREHLGSYDTPEEAFQVYKEAKEAYIKEVADKWKGLIDPRVYEAMYRYEVEITD